LKKQIQILIFLIIFPTALYSQQELCIDGLVKAVKKLQKLDKPKPGYMHYLKLNVEATTRYSPANINPINNSEVNITITSDHYIYNSDYLSMWIDQQNQFIIIHPRKLIIRSKPNEEMTKIDYRQKLLIAAQDSILNNIYTYNCKSFDSSTELISIQPNQDIRKSLLIQKIEYQIDITHLTIKQVVVFYQEPHKLKEQKVKYLRLEANVPYVKSGSDKNQIYNDKGILNKKYSNYKVIDQF
jgi:hypothetical protein